MCVTVVFVGILPLCWGKIRTVLEGGDISMTMRIWLSTTLASKFLVSDDVPTLELVDPQFETRYLIVRNEDMGSNKGHRNGLEKFFQNIPKTTILFPPPNVDPLNPITCPGILSNKSVQGGTLCPPPVSRELMDQLF